jgi:[protein-PII] uridylyltransferase
VAVSHVVAARIDTAPAGYLLAHTSSDIARQCQLLSTLPAHGEVRVMATPGRQPGEWRFDLASRDTPGLLAAFSGALAAADFDVIQAVVATWDDGGALDAFVVRSAVAPDLPGMQAALEASLCAPLWSPPVADAQVDFDHASSAVYTACEVRAVDRPGLLHALAVAFTAAGAEVHAAGVGTVDGIARDRFDLSDRTGRKLDGEMEETIRRMVHHGASPRVRG